MEESSSNDVLEFSGGMHGPEAGVRFNVTPLNNISGNQSLLEVFKTSLNCIGNYSEDDDKNFANDKSSLRFLNRKFLPDEYSKKLETRLDLRNAKTNYKVYTGTNVETLNNLLTFILLSGKENIQKMKIFAKNDGIFLLSKRALCCLLQDPYKPHFHLGFLAKYIDGVVYLKTDDREVHDNSKWRRTKSQAVPDNVSLMAHKFKQILVTDETNNDCVKENINFRCVLTSTVGKHNVCFPSNIDSFDPEIYDEELKDMSAAVNLRSCSNHFFTTEKVVLQREKMLDWCLGIFLSGARGALVGLRDRKGFVNELRLFTEEDLMENGKEFWNLGVCFEFVDELLSFVKKETKSKPGIALLFQRAKKGKYFSVTEDFDDTFPPEWFIKGMKT